LNDILSAIPIKSGMKVLDLGCGSGYLTFPIAKMNENVSVIGLDIVTDTLKRNSIKAQEMGIKNIKFVSYDGVTFPFEDDFFDLVMTRYALHHFPEIRKSMSEVNRVLKCHGTFFISDPKPNDCDTTRFIDDYMQLKKDGHIKFYTKDEWIQICREYNMYLISSFDSKIRFPKKKSTAIGFENILARHEKSIIDSYQLIQTEKEIWVSEQVNNLLFEKK
ncbi:MAG: class I SAM-dependent methyltransferase, partial [Faecalibacillus sp.]